MEEKVLNSNVGHAFLNLNIAHENDTKEINSSTLKSGGI
jgi:hypothetical protein